MKIAKWVWAVIVAAISCGLIGWFLCADDGESSVESSLQEKPTAAAVKPKRRIRPPSGQYARPQPSSNRGAKPKIRIEDDDSELTPEEEKLVDEIGEALNAEDFNAALKLNERASRSDKTEIREAMVETLGWFGRQALPELTPYLADPDEDIVFEATAQWQSALYEIESDAEKAPVIESTMMVLSNADLLEEIAGELNGMDELLAVSVIANVIDGGKEPGVKAAKDAYELVTGDEWAGVEAAEIWLDENYEPDDD